jgi:hypothetical protein
MCEGCVCQEGGVGVCVCNRRRGVADRGGMRAMRACRGGDKGSWTVTLKAVG